MTWFYASSVTVSNGQTVVSVNAGDDIQLAQAAGGLIIGTQPAVEIKRTFLDGSSNKKIELTKPWPYGTQTNQPAMAFPTDGDLAAATAVLKQLIDGFTLATQAEAQAGTENTKPMTALRVKQAMDTLLGTASKLTATTSPTDATEGRALRVRDFGIGTNVGITNLAPNDLRTSGMYATSATWPGSPEPSTDGGNQGQLLHMQHGDPSYAVQVLYSLNTSYGDLVRRISANVPGPWARNITSANVVGPVAANGSAPSTFSAVIERGANANGEYVKFADGTMICKRYRVGDIPMSGGYGIAGLYYGTFAWDFPAVFAVEQPTVSGSGSDPSRIGWVSAYNVGLGGCSPVYFTGSASVNPCGVFLIAIGRWR